MLPRPNWITLCLLLSGAMGYYFFGLLIPGSRAALVSRDLSPGYGYGNDLYQIWLTSQQLLARSADPYTVAMEHRIETGLYGRPLDRTNSADATVIYRGFSYPLYTDILALPLAPLSFHTVQILFSIVLPVMVALSVWCCCAALGMSLLPLALASLFLLTLFSCQVLEGIYALQPTLIVATLLGAALAAVRGNKLVQAGVLLAAASIKPHLSALPTFWLLLWTASDWPRRKRLMVTFVAALGVLLLISEIWLPRWWLGWLRALPVYRHYTMPPWADFLLGSVVARVLTWALLALALAAAVRWRGVPADSPRFFLLYAFLLAIAVGTISSSSAVYDQILLLPAALWLWFDRQSILRASRPLRIVVLLVGMAFLWQWIFAPVVAVGSLLFSWKPSPRAVVFPLITTGSFALGLLSLLGVFVARKLGSDLSTRTTHPRRAPQPLRSGL